MTKELLLNFAKTIIYRIVLKYLTRISVERKCRKAKKLIDSPKVSMVSFDIFDTCIIRSSYLPSDVQKYMDDNNLKSIEEAERQMAHARKCIQDLYQYAVKAGKRVIVVSDMYLGSDVLCNLLSDCGYHGFSHVYVSCECGTTKHEGKLFDYVASCEKISPKAILHIGDDLVSDWWRARKSGWHTVCIPSAYNYFVSSSSKAIKFIRKNLKTWEDRFMFNFILDNCEAEGGLSFKRGTLNVKTFGIACIFPFLYKIADFLIYDPSINSNYEKIYFLSRDGYIPMKAYNIMREHSQKGLEAEYLYGSRYTLNIDKINDEDKIIRFGQYYRNTIKLKEERALVYDTGYKGTVSNIADYFSSPCKIDKVYLWQTDTNKRVDRERNTKTFCLAGDLPKAWFVFFETLLSDNCSGTVIDFCKKENIYEPVCREEHKSHEGIRELAMMQEKALSALMLFIEYWVTNHIDLKNRSQTVIDLIHHYLCGINLRNYRFLHHIIHEDKKSEGVFNKLPIDYHIIKMKINDFRLVYSMKSMLYKYYKDLFSKKNDYDIRL